jgi:hypothetical protein
MALTIGLSVTAGFVSMLLLDELVSCLQKRPTETHGIAMKSEENEGLISGEIKDEMFSEKL